MNCREKDDLLHKEDVDVEGIIRSLAEQFKIVLGKPERVEQCCSELEQSLSVPPSAADIGHISSLLPILSEYFGPLVFPLFDFIERIAASCPDPRTLLKGMLAARDKVLVQRALQLALRCIDNGTLSADRELVEHIAELHELPGKCIADPGCLPLVGDIIRRIKSSKPSEDTVSALFLQDHDVKIRTLAGSVLDAAGEPIPAELAKEALGEDAFAFLAPYLAYTRASHSDVLSLRPSTGVLPPALTSLRRAHEEIGEALLRQIITAAGWPRINLGLEIRHYIRLTPRDSLPLMLFPAEARLTRSCGEIRQATDLFVVVVHGGSTAEGRETKGAIDPASRFRNYNLAHADVLADFLAVAPLTPDKILSIVQRMEAIVEEFIAIFASMSEECSILRGIFDGIRDQILAGLNAHRDDDPLSADLTRLTVMFEDPQSLGQVRTLHGLKRYLHQKGLQLGFKLVQRALSTNRTVTVFLTSRKHILQKIGGIQYADFEPEANAGNRVPYPVAIVADGFARQLLYGHENFPRADIFCYGNEVHYYLSFKNHPAFLRVNYSPPLQGGMIDLEYYGVSKYELSVHPDSSLNALQRFFRSLGFHIEVENTRVHARYDKEHTPDLKNLCEKAEVLFCLAPYLLDIDWTIGGLDLDEEARQKVAAAWAEMFAAWGALPLRSLLTKSRQGIIEAIADTPTGRREVAWSGKGTYRDRFSGGTGELIQRCFAVVEGLIPEVTSIHPATAREQIGQIGLEQLLLLPLRRADARGELVETPDGYEKAPPELFRRMSEPERFAELLASGDLDSAAALAYLIAPLERFLSFLSTGSVGNFEVQSARLSLQDEDLGIHVIRGEKREACLAFYTHGTVLYRQRSAQTDPWKSNALFDTSEFLSLLRRANYPVPGLVRLPPGLPEEVLRMQESLAASPSAEPRKPIPGERTVAGLRATPGRAVGRVLFGTKGRRPEDFAGSVLVTAALQPHDGPFLNRASGIISTGGGILSHAALLAAQFQKPALIIAGRWESDPTHGQLLHYASTEYELVEQQSYGYHICTRAHICRRDYFLREGDLVALDAHDDLVRVLGQDPDTLALHEGFRQFVRATTDLARAANDRDVLLFRGRRIRAGHQIEKILARVADPILTCHTLEEFLQGSDSVGRSVNAGERGRFLRLILNNPQVSAIARTHLHRLVRELRQRYERALRSARHRVPTSRSLHEVASLRLEVLRSHNSLVEVNSCLMECGIQDPGVELSGISEVEELTCNRLVQLRGDLSSKLNSADFRIGDPLTRHLVRQWEKVEQISKAPSEEKNQTDRLRSHLSRADKGAVEKIAGRNILQPEEAGLEFFPVVGWKAANLAEIERVAGGSLVPPWFAVTDCAFRQILESPADRILPRGAQLPDGASTLGKAIETILGQSRLNRFQKSSLIRSLWDAVILPEKLAGEVLEAYRRIGNPELPEPLVALRSSSREEDAEVDARAGEFDTFLFIHGGKDLLKYLLWTWSGLWSDRAIHTREMLGTTTTFAGGGVVIQRIVNSRVSGVLQTINVARNEFREIVINAGWGLGEGIVSGTVAADQIIVSKEGEMQKKPLRFSYMTADKKEYVAFNKRAGFGTTRCEAPYHQRLRPALEYSELCELVAVAVRLESVYGYPLDIEFGIEGSRLWILQVRPVPTAHSLLQETLQNYPLTPSKENQHD